MWYKMEYLVSYKGVILKMNSEREDLDGLLKGIVNLLYAVEIGDDWNTLAVFLNETAKMLRERHKRD